MKIKFVQACALLLGTLLVGLAARAEDPPRKYVRFLEAVGANFPVWDTNHDDALSKAELDAAFKNPAYTGSAAAALVSLRRISQNTNTVLPLTLAGIHGMAEAGDTRPFLYYAEALDRIDHVSGRELLASELPQLRTIRQGDVGDCFCLAPLGAMLNRDPHEVASWFEVQSNQNVLVKMAGGAVSIPPLTEAELALASGNNRDGIWINLYEKAIGQAHNERLPPDKRHDVAFDAISGGMIGPIMSYITGHKVRNHSLRFPGKPEDVAARVARLREQMSYATTNKLLMACAATKPTAPGLPDHHAYAVLEYNATLDKLKLWNPHGNYFWPVGPDNLTNGYFTTNGIFTMPFSDWTNQFDHIIIERPELTPLKWPDEWELMAEAGHFNEAATDLAAIIEADDDQAWQRYLLTPLLIQTSRLADYTNLCKVMLDDYEKTTVPAVAERTAKSCLLLFPTLSANDFSRATNLAAQAVKLSPANAPMHWRYTTLGLAQYRAGQFAETLESEASSRKALQVARDLDRDCCAAEMYFISAMAHRRLQEPERAWSDLKRGQEIVRTRLAKLDSGDLGEGWFDNLMAHILMREAQTTVETSDPAK